MEKQFCVNHPSAAAIGDCAKCAKHLCGFCARFTSTGVLCEACEKVNDTQRFVETETRKHNRDDIERLIEEAPPDSEAPEPESSVSARTVQVIIIFLCIAFVLARVYFLNLPFEERAEPSAVAQEQRLSSLVQCLLVFRQIGEQLAAGVQVSPDLQCADSNVPNIVNRQGETVRISHPNPQIYGYQQFYVTNRNPEPVLVP